VLDTIYPTPPLQAEGGLEFFPEVFEILHC